MIAASVHIRLKWKKPTRSSISRQEARTLMIPRKAVSTISRRLRLSIARWNLIPSCVIHVWFVSASQGPLNEAASGPKWWAQNATASMRSIVRAKGRSSGAIGSPSAPLSRQLRRRLRG